MIEDGVVLEVHLESAKAHLASDHASGVSVLSVDDAFPFNENGGQIKMDDDGPVLDYSEADPDENLIYLTAATTAAYSQDTQVYVYPRGNAKVAMVDLGDGEEPIHALIPQDRNNQWRDGIRDEQDQESVLVSDESGRWVIQAADEEQGTIPYSERWRGSALDIIAGTPGTGNIQAIDFGQDANDSTDITWNSSNLRWEITRDGKYIITGQITMDANTGAGNKYSVQMWVDRLASVNDEVYYLWKMPRDGGQENTVTFVVMRDLSIGDKITVGVSADAVGTPGGPGPYNLPEQVKQGRGKTRVSLAWVGN